MRAGNSFIPSTTRRTMTGNSASITTTICMRSISFWRENWNFISRAVSTGRIPTTFSSPGPMKCTITSFLSSSRYRRIVVFVPVKFFRQNRCEELESFLLRRSLGADCQIPAAIAERELVPLLLKINRYLQEGALRIAKCVLFEFLYQLNQIKEPLAEPVVEDQRIRDVLLWLNGHLTERVTLDGLADAFFLNKYHLCRVFRSVTGMSINQYLNYKRLLLARSLHQNGQTLLEASVNAGFNSYAHFYRMHKKVFGTGPREESCRTGLTADERNIMQDIRHAAVPPRR